MCFGLLRCRNLIYSELPITYQARSNNFINDNSATRIPADKNPNPALARVPRKANSSRMPGGSDIFKTKFIIINHKCS